MNDAEKAINEAAAAQIKQQQAKTSNPLASTLQGSSKSGLTVIDPSKESPALNATQAGTLGLGGATHVVPIDAEVAAATTPLDTAVGAGYADPRATGKEISPPLKVIPDSVQPQVLTADKPTTYMPVIGQQTPTTKAMLAKVLSGASGPMTAEASGGGFNFADLLKGAGGKLGDFLQRWGMGLQGAPTGQTQGDIQRAQEFELQKQQVQAATMAKQTALENAYAQQRMQLQNQMNVANIPIEMKAQLGNRLAELEAQYQNELKLIPVQIQREFAMRQFLPGADPAAHILDQGK